MEPPGLLRLADGAIPSHSILAELNLSTASSFYAYSTWPDGREPGAK